MAVPVDVVLVMAQCCGPCPGSCSGPCSGHVLDHVLEQVKDHAPWSRNILNVLKIEKIVL